jgi:hypothetical protein
MHTDDALVAQVADLKRQVTNLSPELTECKSAQKVDQLDVDCSALL